MRPSEREKGRGRQTVRQRLNQTDRGDKQTGETGGQTVRKRYRQSEET